MTLIIRTTLLFYFAIFSVTSAAQQPPAQSIENKNTKSWTADIGVGYVRTTGNTETESLKGDAKAVKEENQWRHSLKFEALNTSDNGQTTAERYFLSGKTDYKFSDLNYWYITASYEDDRFSGYDYRISESAGYGRRLVDQPNLKIDGEIGPGAKQSKTDAGEHEDEFLLRLAGNLQWKISGNSDFSEEIFSEIGDDETVTKSVTALTANINSSLAMKLSYTIKHTSDVPPGIEKTDTETVVTIVYKYR